MPPPLKFLVICTIATLTGCAGTESTEVHGPGFSVTHKGRFTEPKQPPQVPTAPATTAKETPPPPVPKAILPPVIFSPANPL